MLGVVDVGDCVAGALHCAHTGRVDGNRMVIDGSSAGGYIALCAMTFHDVFAAGSSVFGVSDMETLARTTHKFEARYDDRLIGPYPEARELYRARSPIHHIDRVRRPLILFQGLDDPIVPPEQSEAMFTALREAGIPCAYIAYPGEQHGFRQAAHIARTLEAQHYFFSVVLGGIGVGGSVEPVEIVNRERLRTA
jgi:dipeptidyl aminopeptidase/acylaminoacyl peptidase